MPTISLFYGILIRMFFYDTNKHHVPHIHAEFNGETAVYAIEDGQQLAGQLPNKKHKLVVADWQLAVTGKHPLPIRGLDQ
jgi:Domain of unknown function (DUF4160)